jgi:hypothetical protein
LRGLYGPLLLKGEMMKVRALSLGYYNHKRRKEGEVFDIADKQAFSEIWMEKVGGDAVSAKSVKEGEREPQSFSANSPAVKKPGRQEENLGKKRGGE